MALTLDWPNAYHTIASPFSLALRVSRHAGCVDHSNSKHMPHHTRPPPRATSDFHHVRLASATDTLTRLPPHACRCAWLAVGTPYYTILFCWSMRLGVRVILAEVIGRTLGLAHLSFWPVCAPFTFCVDRLNVPSAHCLDASFGLPCLRLSESNDFAMWIL